MSTKIKESFILEYKGEPVYFYEMKNDTGAYVVVSNYGGTVISAFVPDRKGGLADVVLGFDSIEGYANHNAYFGALIGRYANRINNASFVLDGIEYKLAQNNGTNHLHGGTVGFDRIIWDTTINSGNDGEYLELKYISKDGEENYPGKLEVTVEYHFTSANELIINYFASTDKKTIANFTNHSYFNLGGHDSGDILNHELVINANSYTPINQKMIPTGEFLKVEGTPFDFRKAQKVGLKINEDHAQLKFAKGYDHNFILDNDEGKLIKAAEVYHEESGRHMEVFTTKPGIQLYTGNFLNGSFVGKNGTSYIRNAALCLETQYYPDSPNKTHFTSAVLEPGQKYQHTTIYAFKVK